MKGETTAQLIRRLLNLGPPKEKGFLTLTVDDSDATVFVHFAPGALSALEEGKAVQLGARYWGRLDEPHVPGDQAHLHLYAKGKDQPLLAVNADGTLHHKGSTNRIPAKAAKVIRRDLPQFRLPADNIVEWLDDAETAELLEG